MSQPETFPFQQHRVYLLRDFEYRPTGEVVFSAYAASDPGAIISVRFPNTKVVSIWQESYNPERLPWPLEIIKFHGDALSQGRFRFTLSCLDFEWIWESEWLQFF